MNKLRQITSALCIFSFLTVLCQTWNEVKESGLYFFGEGWGATVEEANQEALKNLIQQFHINVSMNSRQSHQRKEKGNKIESDESLFYTAINSYSQATLDSTIMLVISPAPNAHVGRWVKMSEVNKIFNGRKQKIYSLIEQGERAIKKGKLDVALKCYYWAYTLVKSLPNCNAEEYNGHFLITWLLEEIDNVLSDVSVSIIKINGNDVELQFKFQNKPVNSLDFLYNDGGIWSNLCSAKDGVGIIYLSPGVPMDVVNIQIEYEYRGQAMLDPEIESVLGLTPEYNISRSFFVARKDEYNSTILDFSKSSDLIETFTEIENQFFKKPQILNEVDNYYNIIQHIVEAIKIGNYQSVQKYFTTNGYGIFNKLIRYGNAKIVGKDRYEFTSNNEYIYARGLKLSFSFKNNVRKNFVEDIVFTFNQDSLINNVAFGLGATTLDDILGQSAYPENIRIQLVDFLENYQTAFALKRLDYISTIFDDDAIIIVGTEVRKPTNLSAENKDLLRSFQENKYIKYNRYNKQTYLERLKKGFASKEFINLRFNNTLVRRALNGGNLYGIQIEQDYYSSNYGDHGYLFLEINMNNPDKPLILVRTWQPFPDPEFGLYNETLFPVQTFE